MEITVLGTPGSLSLGALAFHTLESALSILNSNAAQLHQLLDNLSPSLIPRVKGGTMPLLESIRQTAFNLTSRFEGGRVDSLQTVDSGIVSYGMHQATLASGALEDVLRAYLRYNPTSNLAEYLERVAQRDPALRSDRRFHTLLRQAAADPHMTQAQDSVFSRRYWEPAVEAVRTHGLSSPEAYVVFYDTKVQGGFQEIARQTGSRRGAESEQRYLQRFLIYRREYLLALARRRRQQGDAQSARLLEGSARNRIGALLELITRMKSRGK